ncbi:diguanylate cyclase [Aestuariibacter halophilus]|uniref:diguanylate cyclase n=1 Tax=Fluctibacter halophilus TaxID=226011 RepID=A0ABS8G2M5_9ALTE|nr:GGDEF domain-containing protein [Aestuariibacter halophilus]MCC2614834.1 diguanylate cyclase [Aestuariibacter halophilus]
MNRKTFSNGPAKSDDARQQKKLLQTLKHQISQLSQFLIRLSKHYEGVSPELDKELQVLRSHLGGQSNFALVDVSIGKLTGLILQNSDAMRKYASKTLSVLENSVRALQENPAVQPDVLADAQQLLRTLQQDGSSVTTSLPLFERALALYKDALGNVPRQQHVSHSTQPAAPEQERINAKLHNAIAMELQELIGQLSVSNKNDKQLNDIQLQLIKGIDHEALLECCLVIIRAIIRDVVKERKHAEKFVAGLHSSLHKVNQTVGQSLEDAEAHYASKSEANTAIREQLQNIEKAVDESSNLDDLKRRATEHLSHMSSALDDRQNADQEEQRMLIGLLEEMKNQLSQLERETAEYKHRLLEQKYHSHHDPLTQVPNRTAYNERMEMEFRRWQRHKGDLCLAVIDVDHFKGINDNYGHAAGDKTLQVIAQNISRCLRSTDFLARWGGEEFVIIFPNTPLQDVQKPLETIRRHIERIPFKFKEKKVTITVSIGSTYFRQGDDIASVFERADRLLYDAKNGGRNQCKIEEVAS